jgi:outer membrane biosynthesis protein TonB
MRYVLLFCFAAVWLFAPCDLLSAQQPSGTPVHPFKKRFYDRIERAWFRDVQAHLDMIPIGEVRVALTASPDGKITKLRVVSNTSNEFFAQICLRAIHQVKIPPVPTELLTHGKFEDELSFKMFPN